MDSARIAQSIIGLPSATYTAPRIEEVNPETWIVSRSGCTSLTVRQVAGRLVCRCLLFEERRTCPHVEAVERHRRP